jgi:hypothetical protein
LKIAFAITSRNYLAQTKIAVGTFLQFNPNFDVFIFNIDNEAYESNEIWDNPNIRHVFIGTIDFEKKEILRSKYNNFEFCNAIKPYLGCWLFEKYKETDSITYLDSDLVFYNEFTLENELAKYEIIITPHSLSKFPLDNHLTSELDILNSGMYNAGFFVVSNSSGGIKFLEWWKSMTLKYCYVDFEKGMFVDQIWLNFAPIYFESVLVLKNPGYNVAHWNLHERRISHDNEWRVNDAYKLVFFHFSGFSFDDIDKISIHQDRYNLGNRNDLSSLFKEYKSAYETNIQLIDSLIGRERKPMVDFKKIEKKMLKWKLKIEKIIKIIFS